MDDELRVSTSPSIQRACVAVFCRPSPPLRMSNASWTCLPRMSTGRHRHSAGHRRPTAVGPPPQPQRASSCSSCTTQVRVIGIMSGCGSPYQDVRQTTSAVQLRPDVQARCYEHTCEANYDPSSTTPGPLHCQQIGTNNLTCHCIRTKRKVCTPVFKQAPLQCPACRHPQLPPPGRARGAPQPPPPTRPNHHPHRPRHRGPGRTHHQRRRPAVPRLPPPRHPERPRKRQVPLLHLPDVPLPPDDLRHGVPGECLRAGSGCLVSACVHPGVQPPNEEGCRWVWVWFGFGFLCLQEILLCSSSEVLGSRSGSQLVLSTCL